MDLDEYVNEINHVTVWSHFLVVHFTVRRKNCLACVYLFTSSVTSIHNKGEESYSKGRRILLVTSLATKK